VKPAFPSVACEVDALSESPVLTDRHAPQNRPDEPRADVRWRDLEENLEAMREREGARLIRSAPKG
jgi:hypothetical protein